MTDDDDAVGPEHHLMNGLLQAVQRLDSLVYGADPASLHELIEQLEDVETFAKNMRRALAESKASQR